MKYNLDYNFVVIVGENGTRTPCVNVLPQLEMISHVAKYPYVNPKTLDNTIQAIEDAIISQTSFSFSGDDWCTVTVKGDLAEVVNPFDEVEPFEVDIRVVLEMMKGWKAFIHKYENGEVPGLSKL